MLLLFNQTLFTHCRSGYDGKKVDVWASGVLLFVMLLGMFPFEMEDESYVNTAGLYSIW